MLIEELKERLPPSVHLCVDMQRMFAPGAPWATPWLERVRPNVARLARHAPAQTIFTRFITPRASDDMPGTWRSYYRKWADLTRERMDQSLLRLLPELEELTPPARVMDKTVFSGFIDGRLHSLLQSAGIGSIIVSGAETDMCVLATVLAAVDLGYHVVVAGDAVCSASDAAHDALLDLYARRFDVQISVAATDDILANWRP